MKNIFFSVLSLLIFTFSAASEANQRNFYVVASAGYATNEIGDDTHDELSYKLNLGYVLGEQWAVEFGFQGLGDSALSNSEILADSATDYSVSGFKLSALGKAGNQHGELFYRLGVAQIETDTSFALAGSACNTGSMLVTAQADSVICSANESVTAGVIGLGFDFYVTRSLLLRAEIEHIQGSRDYAAQSFLLGLRYNF